MIDLDEVDFDNLKPEEFDQYLNELFSINSGKISEDARIQVFLARNPDYAALVRDIETMTDHARMPVTAMASYLQ